MHKHINLKKMKKISVIIISVIAAFSATSQGRTVEKNTLLSGSRLTGGFVGTTVKVGQVNSTEAYWVGGETGVIFGRDLGIGLAGFGLINSVKSDNTTSIGNPLYYQAGYGGLLIEPQMFENRIFSISFPSVLGIGGMAETRTPGLLDSYDHYNLNEDELLEGDVFWVMGWL